MELLSQYRQYSITDELYQLADICSNEFYKKMCVHKHRILKEKIMKFFVQNSPIQKMGFTETMFFSKFGQIF